MEQVIKENARLRKQIAKLYSDIESAQLAAAEAQDEIKALRKRFARAAKLLTVDPDERPRDSRLANTGHENRMA